MLLVERVIVLAPIDDFVRLIDWWCAHSDVHTVGPTVSLFLTFVLYASDDEVLFDCSDFMASFLGP